ncbi:MAG: cation:proton antiporter [Ardenticatenaceae bacterium]|nr:cation:proton antiporter [Anaerolineales bacterium]MCB8918453.1 cation:proton antiporter [Ardenticatenaceae bacterium]
MNFSLTNLLLILLIAWFAGYFVARLGYPPVLGELAAGMIFGPPLLNLIHPDDGTLVLGKLGVLLMMLFIGMSIKLKDLVRSLRTAIAAALGGFLLPFLLGYLALVGLGYSSSVGLIVGCTITLTALAVVPRMVMDLGLMERRVGQTLIAISLLSVVMTLTGFALVKNIAEMGHVDLPGMALVLGKITLFLLFAVFAGLKLFPLLRPLMLRLKMTTRTAAFAAFILLGLAFAALAEAAGLVFILGAFLAGLFLDPNMIAPGMYPEIMAVKRDVALGFLAPVFFVSAGFAVSFGIFSSNVMLLVAILAAALLGKILGGTLAYLLTRRSWREGLVVGLGMNGRGGVDIVTGGIALAAGLITSEIFTALIFTVFLATLSAPILLKLGAAWLEKRNELFVVESTPAG